MLENDSDLQMHVQNVRSLPEY